MLELKGVVTISDDEFSPDTVVWGRLTKGKLFALIGTILIMVIAVFFFNFRGTLEDKIGTSIQVEKGDSGSYHEVLKYSKDYDEDSKTVSLSDVDTDEKLLDIQLNTPLVFRVMRGNDRKVAEFTLTNYDKSYLFKDIVERMDFYYPERNMLSFKRDFTYKKKVMVPYTVDVFKDSCIDAGLGNGSMTCVPEKVGTEENYRETWEVLSPEDSVGVGSVTIGLFTDVKEGETVEWIPTILETRIDEFAVWVEGFNSGLILYYNFSEGTGQTAYDNVKNLPAGNYTLTGFSDNWTASGLIGNAKVFNTPTTNEHATSSYYAGREDTQNVTFNFWIYRTGDWGSNGNTHFFFKEGVSKKFRVINEGGTKICPKHEDNDAIACSEVPIDEWTMITITYNSSSASIWNNGVFNASGSTGGVGAEQLTFFGRSDYPEYGLRAAYVDELGIWNRSLSPSEITDLYNGGAGMTHTDVFNVAPTTPTWNSPSVNSTTILTDNYFINWTNSTDSNGDTLVYKIDIASDDDFSTIVQSNASVSETATPTGYWVTGLSDGDYFARVRANDGSDNSSWASINWTQQSGIAVTLNVPADDYNSSSESVTFNCSAYDPDDTITNLTLIVGNVERYSITGTRSNESLETSVTLAEGSYEWNCNATTSTSSALGTNYTVLVDTYVDVELVSPDDSLNSTVSSVFFNCTAESSTTINNLSLIIDGVSNYTINPSSTVGNITRNLTLFGSAHTWTCNATTTQSESRQPTERSLTIDPVDVDLNKPTANANFTSTTVEFNCTANSTATLLNMTLFIDGLSNYTASLTSTIASFKVNRTLTEGNHNWTCIAFDIFQFNESAVTSYFEIDTINPGINDVTSNSTIVSYDATNNMTANWTVSDTSAVTTWISYHGENYTGLGAGGSYGLSFNVNSTLSQEFIIYANDSYGNMNSTSVSFTVHYITYVLYESQEAVMEGSNVTLTLYVNKTSIPSTTAILVWNNTDYGFGTRTLTGTSSYKFTKSFTVPSDTGNGTGNLIDYYWNYSMLGVKNDSLTGSQTVMDIEIGINCTLYPKLVINFTLVDQDSRLSSDIVNGSIEITATIFSLDKTINFTLSQNFTDSTNARVCISNFTEGSNLLMSTVTKYSADDHFTQYHYLQDYPLTYSGLAQQVTLYDLLTSRGTAFLVTYKDENSLPVSNAVIDLTRFYTELGSYLSVEHGRTDDYGKSVLHFVENSEIYKLIVRRNNLVEYTTPSPSHANCQVAPCEFNIRKTADIVTPGSFSTIDNLNYNLSFDKDARTITLTYSTNNGLTAMMGLNTTRYDVYTNDTVCADTENSNSGTLTCVIPDSYQNSSYIVVIFKDGVAEAYKTFSLQEELKDRDAYRGTVIFLSFLIFLTIVLMFASDMVLSIVMGVVALIISTVMLLLSGGSVIGYSSFSIVLVVAACIVAWKINNRR